ncbi:hypothetical protein GCM10009689_31840 [Brevibacterium antiquum]|uniref:helix-turn-helix domain-containing protein n=1 Tax=Brevibacterium antiquum TaxID=234835 RepID=UPI0018DF6C3B|nr:helix-turn-helix domain-containing protein [Brevibacterium antiquum]
MEQSRERVFEELLAALGTTDPLSSVLQRAAAVSRGSGLVVNELGEVIRAVGAAPSHLISEWLLSAAPGSAEETQIGRWIVCARAVRIRQREHSIVIAVHEEQEAMRRGPGASGVEVGLVLDTLAKILHAFEGFESFSISTRQEESSRLMRDLEAGVSPGREPARWRALESFGFPPYRSVRVVRAQLEANAQGATGASPTPQPGIVVADVGHAASRIEHTALCTEDFDIEGHFSVAVIGVGISEPFTGLGQVPEMLRAADVALVAAAPGAFVRVETMRPVEWAGARMSSRSDHAIAERFLENTAVSPESWATLTTYVECAGGIAATARRLQVHENTVRYRIGQIEGSLGGRLSDPRTIADVVIALECRRPPSGE